MNLRSSIILKPFANPRNIYIRNQHDKAFGRMFYVANPFAWVSNKFKEYLINAKYEKDFSLKEFCFGAKQALISLAQYIRVYDYENTKPFITDECLKSLKETLPQQDKDLVKALAIKEDDIYLSYPYSIALEPVDDNLDCNINVMFVIFKLFGQNMDKRLISHIDMKFHRIFYPTKISDWIVSDIAIKRLEII